MNILFVVNEHLRKATTAWMQEVERRRRPKPTTAWMQDDSRDGGGRATSGTVAEVERRRTPKPRTKHERKIAILR